MKNIQTKIKGATTTVLTNTLKAVFTDMKKMELNVMIQEELENRIGVDKVDDLLDTLRK